MNQDCFMDSHTTGQLKRKCNLYVAQTCDRLKLGIFLLVLKASEGLPTEVGYSHIIFTLPIKKSDDIRIKGATG